MAIWAIENDGTTVALKYTDAGGTKSCGSGPSILEADLLAWVVDTATPWDFIAIGRAGTFVRLGAPFVSA